MRAVFVLGIVLALAAGCLVEHRENYPSMEASADLATRQLTIVEADDDRLEWRYIVATVRCSAGTGQLLLNGEAVPFTTGEDNGSYLPPLRAEGNMAQGDILEVSCSELKPGTTVSLMLMWSPTYFPLTPRYQFSY